MVSPTVVLEQLHVLHQEFSEILQQLKSGPRRIAARRKKAEAKQSEINERKEQLKQHKMAADQKTLQLKTNEAKIADLRTKLNVATSNREYDIIRSQIDADIMANSVLEDEILEAFDKVDRIEAEIAAALEDLAAANTETERLAGETAAAEAPLRLRASELEAAIAEAEKGIPGTVRIIYNRLVERYGAEALAAVRNKACTSCFAIQSPNKIVGLKAGKVETCTSCGRLLYAPAGG